MEMVIFAVFSIHKRYGFMQILIIAIYSNKSYGNYIYNMCMIDIFVSIILFRIRTYDYITQIYLVIVCICMRDKFYLI